MRDPRDELDQRRKVGLHRQLRHFSATSGAQAIRGKDTPLLNFGSNDYLGLSHHLRLIEAAQSASSLHGTGSRSSRLVTGSLDLYTELESRLATFKHAEAALTFSTGYATAVGTLTALLKKGDTVILDKLCHACLIDGARLSGATVRVFPHHSTARLRAILEKTPRSPDSRVIIVAESVYSMDGDFAPLREMVDLKNEFGAWLLVDEAHALGIYGGNGAGRISELGLQNDVELQMGTLGKAAGSAGGYIAASADIIELLINSSRSFIYSTAPPPSQAAASIAALDIIQSAEGDQLRAHLRQLMQAFAPGTSCQIIPHPIGDADSALRASAQLLEQGLFVPAIRYPTVPRQQARLRISLTTAHTLDDIQTLRSALAALPQ